MTSLQTLLMEIKGENVTSKKWKNMMGRADSETIFPGYANRYEGEGGRILSNPQEKKILKFTKRDFLP